MSQLVLKLSEQKIFQISCLDHKLTDTQHTFGSSTPSHPTHLDRIADHHTLQIDLPRSSFTFPFPNEFVLFIHDGRDPRLVYPERCRANKIGIRTGSRTWSLRVSGSGATLTLHRILRRDAAVDYDTYEHDTFVNMMFAHDSEPTFTWPNPDVM